VGTQGRSTVGLGRHMGAWEIEVRLGLKTSDSDSNTHQPSSWVFECSCLKMFVFVDIKRQGHTSETCSFLHPSSRRCDGIGMGKDLMRIYTFLPTSSN